MTSKLTETAGIAGHTRSRTVKVIIAIGIAGLALLIALFLAHAVFMQPFNSPSTSGEPGIMLGDAFMVNKLAYQTSDPQRGDVAVITVPQRGNVAFIMRVIGLPGEVVQMKNGIPHINGKAVGRVPVSLGFALTEAKGALIYRETLPEGRSHLVADATEQGGGDNTEEYHVPAGHYFLLGDNRDNAADSRYPDLLGFVPRENFVGRYWFPYFTTSAVPLNDRPALTTEP